METYDDTNSVELENDADSVESNDDAESEEERDISKHEEAEKFQKERLKIDKDERVDALTSIKCRFAKHTDEISE